MEELSSSAEVSPFPAKIAIVCDSPDEKWPSMDLVGEMHSAQLTARGIPHQTFAPPIHRRTPSFALDRLWFRFGDYPSLVRRQQFDLFHIVDHSYSQLIHSLPPQKTVVTCHDLDTFRSVLQPDRHPRGMAFRWMTRRILDGFSKAGHVACDSIATYDEIRKFQLLPPERLSVVPLGVHPACSPLPNEAADREAVRLLGGFKGPALLHVGSTLPRKRIDIVLRTFAAAHARYPELRLIRAGGPMTKAQSELALDLKLDGLIFELPFLERPVLAAIYRRATLVLQPSDAEGFGLPVAESMACGTPVIASDLAVLREVGGEAAIYFPPGNIQAWKDGVFRLLESPMESLREISLRQAADFSWVKYTNRMLDVYNSLLNL
jgi:glycosyltransferase involved in cell wall biosynthesis